MNEVNGILNLIKPVGWTSMDVVRKLKRLTRQKKVGHAGTLDPEATGILPICFGQATRVMEYLVDSPKSYEAVIKLGISTDSYDAVGAIVKSQDPSNITQADVENGLLKYVGAFDQVPPMYSALKKDGERLYNLARAGKEVVREPREVNIYNLDVLEYNLPEIRLLVECGRGMYVRSLAHDLGEDLGCGAHLKELKRVSSGPFNFSNAISVEEAEHACVNEAWQGFLFPVDFPLSKFKAAVVKDEKRKAVIMGQSVYLGFPSNLDSSQNMCRLYSEDGMFLALMGLGKTRGVWKANKVFNLNGRMQG